VFFFSASLPEYANPIINKIAPEVRSCRRFFRDFCKETSGYLVKDLSILRRSLAHSSSMISRDLHSQTQQIWWESNLGWEIQWIASCWITCSRYWRVWRSIQTWCHTRTVYSWRERTRRLGDFLCGKQCKSSFSKEIR
jgi:hypothetical protein